MRRGWILVAAVGLGGCSLDNPGPMWAQRRYSDYRASDFFADGRAMQPPVPGTVPQERARGTRGYLTGSGKDGQATPTFPLAVDRSLLLRGRHDFDIYCATCHGKLGDGSSFVAKAMPLRQPPPIAEMTFKPGEVFGVITRGYGLMPSFAPDLSVRARWGVVAYLQALHESQHAPLEAAPEKVRAMLEKERP